MKRLILILFLISSPSCVTSDGFRYKAKHQGVDKEFQPYVDEFVLKSQGSITKEQLDGITIGFSDLEGNTVGTCYPSLVYTEIDIDKNWWNENKDQRMREQLILHELGHCVLFREHTEPTSSGGFFGWFENMMFKLGIWDEKPSLRDGCPISYMYPSLLSEQCIDKHYKYYIDELFGRKYPYKYL